ncbi:hypothetical protein JXA02_08065 [candidate division KSB1 bacterium]|nr:hypothetical protein [candidate division KSB1 bacterium]
MSYSQTVLHGRKLTRRNFKNPPLEMGILPFWFWNGELDERELEWQMHEYYDHGIRGLFIHGRFGLKVPYLSAAWFARVKYVVEKAKEIGLAVWVYDEMNWPSGTADKQVLRRYPHLRQKYLELTILDVPGPLFTFLEASDDRYVNTGNSRPVAAFACPAEEFETGIVNLLDLTPNLSFDVVIPWEAPPGNWKLLYFLEKEVDYYIDALDPESTQRFIELTHDQYKDAVAADFGSIVPGFYTDEPAMHYYHVGMDNTVIPWSNRMFKIFRDRRGYDLRPYLPALFANMGDKTAELRYDFWRTLTEQYAETYYKRIRDWCDENKVIFTGHLLFEEWLRGHARCEGNIFKYLKQMHLTGVDHLYPKIGSEDEPAEHVSLKMASSAAHHFGSRLLCESMGGTYWDCTLERMKWIANWEYVLGVNLFNNHGYHYSIEGERKRDWPPSQFYHHTWWKYYKKFTTYMARLGHILSGGRHVAKILILYPINSIWANYVPQKRDAIGAVIEADYNYLTDTLLRLHYDFDFVDEDVLAGAKIRAGKMAIADEEYELLILPPITHIKAATWRAIKRFVESGGSLIGDTLLPITLLEDSSATQSTVADLFGLEPISALNSFRNNAPFSVTHKNAIGNVFFFGGGGLSAARAREALDSAIRKCIVADVTIDHKDVFYLHRIKDSFDIYFFVNTSRQDLDEVEITFEKIAAPELWDPETGDIKPILVFQVKEDRLVVRLPFPAVASRIVVLRGLLEKPFISASNGLIESFDGKTVQMAQNGPAPEMAVRLETAAGAKELRCPAKETLPAIPLPGPYELEMRDDNALLLNAWKMSLAADNQADAFMQPDYNDRDWLDVTMGAWEMQLPQERDNSVYPVILLYRTAFFIRDLPQRAKILIDGFSGRKHLLFINGHAVRSKGRRSALDAEIKEVDVQPLLKSGRNVVAVRLEVNRRTDGILDPLKIIGDFGLQETDTGFVIVDKPIVLQVGDWTKQGLPFYSGACLLGTSVDVPEHYLDGRLELEVECGEDVLQVWINDIALGSVAWHPYRIDVTGQIKPGNNSIKLQVTNTLINMLEGVQKQSGLLAAPLLRHRHRYRIAAD